MAQLPPKLSLSPADAQELLRFLELRLNVDGCDNTHRFTRSWAASEDLDPEQVVELVKRHGGFHCDCEVVENAKSIGVGEPSTELH